MTDSKRIFLSPPDMGEKEFDFLKEAFQSNWIAPLGPFVNRFESDFKKYVGSEHAVALASGTAAIHLALISAGVGPGDTVFCSDLTFVASANPIKYVGATPVFIDSNPSTWNIDVNILEEDLEKRQKSGKLPKAMIVAHIFGQAADIVSISALCAKYGIFLIEDAAESLGTTINNRHTGTFGNAGVFSFNGNKIITTSGGGMLVTNSGDTERHTRHLSTQAKLPFLHYEHEEVGFNYRLSNLLAAVGVGQLQGLEHKISKRRSIFERYRLELETYDFRFQEELTDTRSNRWLTAFHLDGRTDLKERIISKMTLEDIEVRPVWKPMHRQPLYEKAEFLGTGVSAQIFASGLCLPSGSALNESEQTRIIGIIKDLL